MKKRKIFFLVGPTASGKTAVSVFLAKKLGAEIISCDSMQLYRGMDILTSKPPHNLLAKVPHHLVGFVPLSREYNVALYRQAALKEVAKIYARGKAVIFVGGTGLYATALIDGLFDSVPPDRRLRVRLSQQAEEKGNSYIYNRLRKVDPQAAAKIHPHDRKRIIRALEVYLESGRRISQLQKERRGLAAQYKVIIFGLDLPRALLYKRIDERVEKMFKDGLLKEARRLDKLALSRTAYYVLGLRELKGYFAGKYSLDEAKTLIKRGSRRYAKRQLTWFKKDRRIKWINLKGQEKPREVAGKIWKKLS